MTAVATEFSPIHWHGDKVVLIDQTKLPSEEVYVECRDWQTTADAIKTMVVRGAPAIGITAAYGVALAANCSAAPDGEALLAALAPALAGLADTRPTAVNLFWALDRMRRVAEEQAHDVTAMRAALVAEAVAIHVEDVAMCKAIGANGAPLFGPNSRILTHCNTGALATGGYGTALGVIRSVAARGHLAHVYADETRPFLQGSRLTAWELAREGLPVSVITDSMAAYFMQQGLVDAVVVGTDRVAANGDVANKIGTYNVAVLCAAHGLPFYVAGPSSTVDLGTPSGDQIPIEQRPAREVTHAGGHRVVPLGVRVENPAFDVTPARLVTAIITEHAVVKAPYVDTLPTAVHPHGVSD